MRALPALAAAALALAGCARLLEDRVEDELLASGLPAPMAACMAGELAGTLDARQLRKLTRLGPEPGEPDVPLTLAGVLERVNRVGDPQVVEVAATAAAVCALESF